MEPEEDEPGSDEQDFDRERGEAMEDESEASPTVSTQGELSTPMDAPIPELISTPSSAWW